MAPGKILILFQHVASSNCHFLCSRKKTHRRERTSTSWKRTQIPLFDPGHIFLRVAGHRQGPRAQYPAQSHREGFSAARRDGLVHYATTRYLGILIVPWRHNSPSLMIRHCFRSSRCAFLAMLIGCILLSSIPYKECTVTTHCPISLAPMCSQRFRGIFNASIRRHHKKVSAIYNWKVVLISLVGWICHLTLV